MNIDGDVADTRPKIQLIRCKLNKYGTPLFSFDYKGIYVKCKDCRTLDREGKTRRGTFHLVPWAQLFGYFVASAVFSDKMGVIDGVIEQHGLSRDSDDSDLRVPEIESSVDELSG